MAKGLLLLLLTGWLNVSFCQKLTKKEIDKGFANADTIGGKKKEKLYVLNGVPFDNSDSAKLDSALAVFDLKYLVSLDILKFPYPNLSHLNNDVVLLRFATQQKIKTKRKVWHKANRFIKETYPGKSLCFEKVINDFSLSIDNTSIPSTKIKEVLKTIKVKDIYYVAFEEVKNTIEGKPAGAMLKIWKKPQ
jgi:hypothetical protein